MLKQDDVISYAKSYDSDAMKIIVSNNVIKTQLQDYSSDSIVLKGTEYAFAPKFKDAVKSGSIALSIGADSTVYIDCNNEVVYISQSGQSDTVYAIFGDYLYNNSMSDLKIQAYTQQGNVVELLVKKSVMIDGEKYTKEGAYSYFKNNDLKYELVGLVYGNDYVLKSIDTPYFMGNVDLSKENADSLHYIKNVKKQSGSDYMYGLHATNFGGQVAVDGNTVIFCLPPDITGIDDIGLTDISSSLLVDGCKSYTISAYSTTENSCLADFVVLDNFSPYYDLSDNSYTTPAYYGIVTKVTNAVNNNGETINAIYVDNGYSLIKLMTEDDDVINFSKWAGKGDKVDVGDIVIYVTLIRTTYYTREVLWLRMI